MIGAGPGGYVGAIRAAQLGMTVACIDKRPTLGGTCLNVGCIPSKALLNASEHFAAAASGGLADIGIGVGKVALDLPRMMQSKQDIVENLTVGIDFLFKKNKITRLEGSARITAPGAVTITDGKDKGSSSGRSDHDRHRKPCIKPAGYYYQRKLADSQPDWGALAVNTVPKKLVVIGARLHWP